jgi:hypothetical protein
MSEKIYIGFWVFDQMAEESCQEVVEQANYLVPNPPVSTRAADWGMKLWEDGKAWDSKGSCD